MHEQHSCVCWKAPIMAVGMAVDITDVMTL